MAYKIINVIIPALLCLLYYFINKDKKWILFFLAAFFLFTCLGELIGLLLVIYNTTKSNLEFYDKFFLPSSYLFQFAIFHYAIKNKNYKNIVAALSIIYLLCFLVEKFIIHYDVKEFSYFSFCVGSLFVIIASLLYLLSLIKSAAILNFKTDVIFWFSIGSLFFQIFTFPLYALMDLWYQFSIIGNALYSFSIYCMYVSYLFYLIGVLCLKRK